MTITLTREEAQQVLNWLQQWMAYPHDYGYAERKAACKFFRAKLAQPEPEPLAWLYAEGLEALQAGKCWTAYGTKQDDDCKFPVYIK